MKLKKLDKQYMKSTLKFIERIFGKGDAAVAKADFAKELNQNKAYRLLEYYLLFKGKDIIAMTGLYSVKVHPKKIAWNAWFGVDKKYRNKGLGSRLLKWTGNKAKKSGFKYLYVVASPDARLFYKKNGFKSSKAIKLRKFYFPRGSSLLYKKL